MIETLVAYVAGTWALLYLLKNRGSGNGGGGGDSGIHPRMFLNQSEINDIKNRKSQSPWNTAYNDLMNQANEAYNSSIPILGHHYYCGKPYGASPDYQIIIKFGKYTRALGLMYAISGQTKYADKLIDYIYIWCVDQNTKMYPAIQGCSTEETIHQINVTIPGMFYGADLIWNYWGNLSDVNRRGYRDTLQDWTDDLVSNIKGYDLCRETYCQNKEMWRQVLIASGSVISENNTWLNESFGKYKQLISPSYKGGMISPDGCLPSEVNRDTGLEYSTFAMKAMISLCEIARHNSVDLYNYKNSEGSSIETVLDKYDSFCSASDPAQEWRNNCNCKDQFGNSQCTESSQLDSNEASLYEIAYNWKQKSGYKAVIQRWGRPMYENRVMGQITLTHGK